MLVPRNNNYQVANRYSARYSSPLNYGSMFRNAYRFYKWYRGSPSSAKAVKAAPKATITTSVKIPRKSVKPFPKKIKSQIRELKRLSEADMGSHTHRRRTTGALVSAVDQKVITSGEMQNLTILEGVISQLRYYDPTAPTNLVTGNGTTGSYQKEFLFKSSHHAITLRNNYQVGCHIRLYLVSSKVDTSIAANNAFTAGLADVGAPASTSPLVFVSDSQQFKDLYKIVKSKMVYLKPGSSVTLSYNIKPFQYDPSLSDSHSLTYQKRFHDLQFMVDLLGAVGHDITNSSEQTNIQAGVDWEVRSTWVVKYSAGASIEYLYVDDQADTAFTNSGVVSQMPIADNQTYSVS